MKNEKFPTTEYIYIATLIYHLQDDIHIIEAVNEVSGKTDNELSAELTNH